MNEIVFGKGIMVRWERIAGMIYFIIFENENESHIAEFWRLTMENDEAMKMLQDLADYYHENGQLPEILNEKA